MRTPVSFNSRTATKRFEPGALSKSITRARAFVGVPVLEVRFEDLVADVDSVLARMCAFIDLPFVQGLDDPGRRADRLLPLHDGADHTAGRVAKSWQQRAHQQASTGGPIDAAKVGVWRSELTHDEVAEFERIAGDLLRASGY